MIRISNLIEKEDNLNLIHTNKYKDINVYIRSLIPYNPKLNAALIVLSSMMEDRSQKYPTKKEYLKAKDMLYGLRASFTKSHFAGNILFTIHYSFTNPIFTKNVSDNDYINFIDETIRRPYLDEDSFNENKKIVIDDIKRRLDKPNTFANNNFFSEITKDDNRYVTEIIDNIDDINSLKLSDIIEAYNQLFNHRVDIYLIGDYTKELKEYLATYKSKENLIIDSKAIETKRVEEIVYSKPISQSTLIVSYRVPYFITSPNYYAYRLAGIIFGGSASSLLFSEVREKNSLCYSINANLAKSTGLIKVTTNIDKKNKDKVIDEINKQVRRIKMKDYDTSLVDVSKSIIINSLYSMDDDLDALVDHKYINSILGVDLSTDEIIENINSVTIDDIAEVFNHLDNYITYFLEGSIDA